MDPTIVEEVVEKVVAYTGKGPIEGTTYFYNGGREKYYFFEHVPYADVPIGNLRFADPKNIRTFGDLNLQARYNKSDENCLFLRIYTPQVRPDHYTRPVIVFVPDFGLHLRMGEFKDFSGEYVISGDAVFVVLNYRKAILGFTGIRASDIDEEELGISGVAGIRDIIKGFEFVKEEIRHFGGCPDNITAYGHGLSCAYLRYILRLSQFSDGEYFHKMILSSSMEHSMMFNPPTVQYDIRHIASEIASHIAQKTGGPPIIFEDDKACVEYLRKVSIGNLLEQSRNLFDGKAHTIIVRRNNLLAVQRDIYDVKMPVLIGFNSLEFLYEKTCVLDPRLDPVKYLSDLLLRLTQIPMTEAEAVPKAAEIIELYRGNHGTMECIGNSISDDTILDLIDQDIKYLVGMIHLAANLAKGMHPQNVYLYQFSVSDSNDSKWNQSDNKYYPGAMHADEFDVIFKRSKIDDELNTVDQATRCKHLARIWTQFAKTGNPNPTELVDTWRPIGERLTHYYEIGHTGSSYRELTPFETVRLKLWETVYGIDLFSAQNDITSLEEIRRPVLPRYIMWPEAKSRKKVTACTSIGSMPGYVCSDDGNSYCSFQHVPYAQVPVGNLRFAAPKDIRSVNDVKKCLKLDDFGRYGLEDHLFLHIYTRELKPNNKSKKKFTRPVIVFVPGQLPDEAERYRSEDLYGPQFLMREDVVLVVLSYRRGILGFTAFDEPNAELDVPIDAGFQDVMQGFRFVKREIRNFGGCPDNVTAYGQGTGAAWVRRIAAKHSKDKLFHKMILSSSMEHAKGIEMPMPRYNVRHLVKVDLNQEDFTEDKSCIEFLRNMPIEQLLSRDVPFFKLPVKDRMFHKKHLMSLAKESYETTMPVLLGYNATESLIETMITSNYDQNDIHQTCWTEGTDQLSDDLRPRTERVGQINEFYFQYYSKMIGKKNLNTETKIMLSDACYIVGTIALASHFARTMAPGHVFLYRFNVSEECNFTKKLYSCASIKKAVHADELGYIFKTPMTRYMDENVYDNSTMKMMTKLWARFARTGNPNPEPLPNELPRMDWEPVGEKLSKCFDITMEFSEYCRIPPMEVKRFKFWETFTGLNFFS